MSLPVAFRHETKSVEEGLRQYFLCVTCGRKKSRQLTLGLQLAGAAHPSLLERLLLDGCGRGGLDGLARSATATEEHAAETVTDRGTDGDTGSRGSHLSERAGVRNKDQPRSCARTIKSRHQTHTWPKRPGPWEGAAAAGTGAG